MTGKTSKQLLEGAYGLESAKDNVEYYKDFASSYDANFADAMGYNAPAAIAQVFKSVALPEDLPIADIGCGTGLTCQALDLPKAPIDGFDISPEMLEKAREKNIYRALYCADLTRSLQDYSGQYGALISSGTFTLGHLGPNDLVHLLDMLKPHGLVCITVNTAHFNSQGFEQVLGDLQDNGKISQPKIHTVPIYAKGQTHDHASDMAHILSFRTLY